MTVDGFMTVYEGEMAMGDIAEMASWSNVREMLPDSKGGACDIATGRSNSSIVSGDVATFIKLGFARTLKLITEQQYKECVSNIKIYTLVMDGHATDPLPCFRRNDMTGECKEKDLAYT